ncbi:acyltransferase [soil metagenome]
MALAGGHPAGFDYLRVILALLVILDHSFAVTVTDRSQIFGWFASYMLFAPVIPAFFALSGFLVAGSLERSRSLISFGGLRVLRIVPALAVDTIFCAFLLGPWLTALPLEAYFTSPLFFTFLSNVTGDIHYYLPGLFVSNPAGARVNGQLWTIPFELLCYVSLSAFALFGLYKKPAYFVAAAAITGTFIASYYATHSPNSVWHHALPVPSFLLGVALFALRQRVRYSPWLATVALVGLGVSSLNPWLRFFAPIPIVYLTMYLGLTNPRRVWPITTGDYSYGLYLYGFPIQQTLVQLSLGRNAMFNFGYSIALTGLLALASWHLLEKRVLTQKPRLYRLEQWLSDVRPGLYRFLKLGRPSE